MAKQKPETTTAAPEGGVTNEEGRTVAPTPSPEQIRMSALEIASRIRGGNLNDAGQIIGQAYELEQYVLNGKKV